MLPTKESIESLFKSLVQDLTISMFPTPLAIIDEQISCVNTNLAIEKSCYGTIDLDDRTDLKILSCRNCASYDCSPRIQAAMKNKAGIGYCWIHNIPCTLSRTCNKHCTGKSITSDNESYSKQKNSL